MANQKIYSLEPIIDQQASVLILGSIPGKQSLKKQQYYGNLRNHFWPILFEIYQQEWMETYQEKVSFLHDKGIALWDVIGACYREGSLDSSITDADPNQLEELLDTYPTIKRIGCNGTKSYQTFRKHFAHLMAKYEVRMLPSTSPIPGRYNKSFEEKVEIWKGIFEE
ncbi:DNA-deoxyinosine glycosylase [Gracilibacillus salinarum]|uniref:DNA-deoxyinosine glycosylase n=1 Tax=Gracilibacillus salinarum TaxID=2932255 RepID=A0ABY4GKK5_9BACI|nr:DNA-deoxyinosine glycosylase [Gracilibacillus salinarum]UOQ84739.1 DNA-deoxyinosine glycosylase [Gracilibacillus salinarum]